MTIASSLDAYLYLRKILTADVEEFWAIALRADGAVLRSTCLFRGTVDTCYAHPRDVFRFACVENASAILVSHNHPSQDPRPSSADRIFTRRLVNISRVIGIPLLDHIILGGTSYWSFADKRVHVVDGG